MMLRPQSSVILIIVLSTASSFASAQTHPRVLAADTATPPSLGLTSHQPTGATCPADNGACQLPDQQGHGSMGTLLANNNDFLVAENFSPEADGTINAVCWWGGYFDFVAGADCGPGPGIDDFQVTIYLYEGPTPGPVHAGPFDLGAVTPVPTGEMVGPLAEYLFTASLGAEVALSGDECYWIELVNLGNQGADCRGLWSTAPAGDNASAQSTDMTPGNYGESDYDLAVCGYHDTVSSPGILPAGCGLNANLGCPPGAIAENEPTCADDYVDLTNAGCNADPGNEAWIPVTLGQTYCGTSGGFQIFDAPCTTDSDCFGGSCVMDVCDTPIDARDSDWWSIEVFNNSLLVEATITTEFPALVGFVDDQDHSCADPTFLQPLSFGCNPPPGLLIEPFTATTMTVCLYDTGDWTFFVAPSGFGPAAAECGESAEYHLRIELGDTGQGLGVCPTTSSAVCNIEDGLQCQFPDYTGQGAALIEGTISDANASLITVEDLQSLAGGSITEICWYGFYADLGNGGADCGPGEIPDDFTIRYYDDAGGQPGDVIAEFSQGDFAHFNKLANCETTEFQHYTFSAGHAAVFLLPNACVWVGIQGQGGDAGSQCTFHWDTAPPGDSRSWTLGGVTPMLNDFDLALCVNTFIGPNGCEISGACCDEESGTCIDDVPVNACAGRFEVDTVCAALDPPCAAGSACAAVAHADCGDLDGDGIRDSACDTYSCDKGACMATPRAVLADMGGEFGVCEPDGTADANDRFLALACFANDWNHEPCEVDPPTAINIDAGGQFGLCALDGKCDGNDAFHAINSFAGTNTCDAVCSPSPTPPGGVQTRNSARRRPGAPGERP